MIKHIASLLKSLALALFIAFLTSVFIFQPTKVLGSSMEPTLHNNETIFVSKIIHTLCIEPDYNDIVVIDSRVGRERTLFDDLRDNSLVALFNRVTSNEEHPYWVKRVIGKPGDVLEFKDHKVLRNGEELEEPYIKEPMMNKTNEKVVVPPRHVFVMGDNRNNSTDSRYIGPVPLENVLGRMIFHISKRT